MSFRSNAVFTHYMSVIQPKRHIAAPGCDLLTKAIGVLGLLGLTAAAIVSIICWVPA